MFYKNNYNLQFCTLFYHAIILILSIMVYSKKKFSIIQNRVIPARLTTTFVSAFLNVLSNISSVVNDVYLNSNDGDEFHIYNFNRDAFL